MYGVGDTVNVPTGAIACPSHQDLLMAKSQLFDPANKFSQTARLIGSCVVIDSMLINHTIVNTIGPNAQTADSAGNSGWVAINDLYLVRSSGDEMQRKAAMDRYQAWLMTDEALKFFKKVGVLDGSADDKMFKLQLVVQDDFMARKIALTLPPDRLTQIIWIARVMATPLVGPSGDANVKKGETLCSDEEAYYGYVLYSGTPAKYRSESDKPVKCRTLDSDQVVKVGPFLEYPTFVVGVTLADGSKQFVSSGLLTPAGKNVGDVAGARKWKAEYDEDRGSQADLKSMALLPGLSNDDEAPEGDWLFFSEFSKNWNSERLKQ
jgi:hypothetical protein